MFQYQYLALRERERERDDKTSSFTLIELLIVVAIIGILAALIIVSVTTAAAKGRDAVRIQDLKNMEQALEMYYTANGSYPSTSMNWWGYCSNAGSHPLSGLNGYIPNIAPTYMSSLPEDPEGMGRCAPNTNGNLGSFGGFIYKSNGIDYKVLADDTLETTICHSPYPLSDYRGVGWCQVSTPGAVNW